MSVLFTGCQICACIIYTSLIFIYVARIGDAIHNGAAALRAPSWTLLICVGQRTSALFGKIVAGCAERVIVYLGRTKHASAGLRAQIGFSTAGPSALTCKKSAVS